MFWESRQSTPTPSSPGVVSTGSRGKSETACSLKQLHFSCQLFVSLVNLFNKLQEDGLWKKTWFLGYKIENSLITFLFVFMENLLQIQQMVEIFDLGGSFHIVDPIILLYKINIWKEIVKRWFFDKMKWEGM